MVRFQVLGHEGLDYSCCLQRQAFDERYIRWDLNYFKYCFLRLAGIDMDENKLENDFDRLVGGILRTNMNYFMFRDFQPRNIIIQDGEVYFINYQKGCRGPLQYDVASLLYDIMVQIPNEQKEELLEYYIEELGHYAPGEVTGFRELYYPIVLVRLLQMMGTLGLRGLHRLEHRFSTPIIPGLQEILYLFKNGKLGEDYPELQRVINMAFYKYFEPLPF